MATLTLSLPTGPTMSVEFPGNWLRIPSAFWLSVADALGLQGEHWAVSVHFAPDWSAVTMTRAGADLNYASAPSVSMPASVTYP